MHRLTRHVSRAPNTRGPQANENIFFKTIFKSRIILNTAYFLLYFTVWYTLKST